MANHGEEVAIRLTLQGSSSALGCSLVSCEVCGNPNTLFFCTNDDNSRQQGFLLVDHGVVFSVACGCVNLETPSE